MDFLTVIEPIWKVLAVGLLLGAGLPAIFALGVHLLDASRGGAALVSGQRMTLASGASKIAAGLCFLIIVLAVALGLAILIDAKAVLPAIGLG